MWDRTPKPTHCKLPERTTIGTQPHTKTIRVDNVLEDILIVPPHNVAEGMQGVELTLFLEIISKGPNSFCPRCIKSKIVHAQLAIG